jgi:hypothetical protein
MPPNLVLLLRVLHTRWAMIEDCTEEFLTTSSGEGSLSLPSHRRCGTGASLAPVTTTLRMENALAAQAMMTVPPWMAAPWLKTGLPFERRHARHGGQQAQARAQQPTAEQWAATSVRRGRLRTTSRGFSRRPAQTAHTPSGTSSRLRYDVKLHDLRVPHLGCGARRRAGRERYNAVP